MKTPRTKKDSGSTIIAALVTTLLLGTFVAIAVDYTSTVGRNAQRDRVFNTAVEIGDGYLELAFASWRQLCQSSRAPASSAFAAIPTPSPGNFPSFPDAVVSNFKVQAVTPTIDLTTQDPPTSTLDTSATPPPTNGVGSGTESYFYLATVDVTLPYKSGTLTAKVRRVFEKRYTSAWNWAMLFNDELELHPDQKLTLNGWVHSNKTVYAGNGEIPNALPDGTPLPTPTPNLFLTDRLSYAGNYTSGYSPNDPRALTHTNFADGVSPADLPPGREQIYSPFDWNPTQFNTTDSNVNNDGYREMIERPVTGSSNPDPFAATRLYNQAQLAVLIDGSNNVTAYWRNADGTKKNITSNASGADESNAKNAVINSIRPGFYIQDGRELEPGGVRTVNFDVATFMSYYPSSITKGWNGIIYISDTSGNSTTTRGIRVVNGSKVPSGGITIASDNPVYIQGDFNTGRSGTAEPKSNLDPSSADYEQPEADGYDRRPASIMADAVTLLSNSWNDANGGLGLSGRIATNTTVNAALIAGNVASNGTRYGGGGENFVRFLEDWTGKSFTYHGSMLGLFASQQATGLWGNGNVYAPADLKWYFDKKLSVDENGEPVKVPGYISTVAYLQQQRWYLQY